MKPFGLQGQKLTFLKDLIYIYQDKLRKNVLQHFRGILWYVKKPLNHNIIWRLFGNFCPLAVDGIIHTYIPKSETTWDLLTKISAFLQPYKKLLPPNLEGVTEKSLKWTFFCKKSIYSALTAPYFVKSGFLMRCKQFWC